MKKAIVLALTLLPLLSACGPSHDSVEQRRTEAINALVSLNQSVVIATPEFHGERLSASVTNGLDVALRGLDFVYEARTPGRAVAWQEGDGFFSIDGGLEPGETRELIGLPLKMRFRHTDFTGTERAIAEHPDAQVVLTITGAVGADKKSILPSDAFVISDGELQQLRQRLAGQ